jgi:hypothetical protein
MLQAAVADPLIIPTIPSPPTSSSSPGKWLEDVRRFSGKLWFNQHGSTIPKVARNWLSDW